MRFFRGFLTYSALLASTLVPTNCYRAEIDLAPLRDASGGHAGGAGGAGDAGDETSSGNEGGTASAAPPADAGRAAASGGAEGGSSAAEGGAAGAPPRCDDSWRDTAEDTACRQAGIPTRAECADQPLIGWRGCYDGGCSVCTGLVADYPHYFNWHPCCTPNDTCSNHQTVLCNSRCPPPTAHDRIPPCGVLDPNPG